MNSKTIKDTPTVQDEAQIVEERGEKKNDLTIQRKEDPS